MLDCKFFNSERLVFGSFFSTSIYLEIWKSYFLDAPITMDTQNGMT